MPTILGFAALFLLATDALNMDLSLMPGVSAKNLIIYLIAMVLALRMVVSRGSIMAAGQMQGAFIIMIGYAIVTWLVAALLVQYPQYDLVASGIKLKSALIDHYIFFLVFLFGVQTTDDALKVIKGLLFGALLANVITILDAAGVISLGFRIREDGRTAGAIGESNQYAAFIILFLPATLAAAVAAHGFKRLFWFVATLVACMTLVMTASRGGFVGLAMMCAVGAYLYRHLISYSRISGWVFGSLILLVLAVSFSQYGNLLAERLIGTGSIDASTASSGRSEIWSDALSVMFHNPISLITGFGWDAYCVHAVPVVAAQSLSGVVVQPGPGRAVLRGLSIVFRHRARAARQPARRTAGARAAHRVRTRRRGRLHRGVLRRPAQALVLFLDVRRSRHAHRAVRANRIPSPDRRPCRRCAGRRYAGIPMAGPTRERDS